MLVETQPTQFDTLVRLSGFSHGTDVWAGNIRDLIVNNIATVNETVGCRDDIMLYLIQKGMEPSLAFKTMEAMRDHEVPEWYIESLAKIGYLFPKAHAVAYVMMAFRIAWYKVHEPLAFYATFFSVRAKAFDAEYCCAGKDAVKRKIREIENNKDATAVEQNLLTTLEVCYEFYLRGFHFDTINRYIIGTRIGQTWLAAPIMMTPEEYMKWSEKHGRDAYFRSKNDEIYKAKGKEKFDFTDMDIRQCHRRCRLRVEHRTDVCLEDLHHLAQGILRQ